MKPDSFLLRRHCRHSFFSRYGIAVVALSLVAAASASSPVRAQGTPPAPPRRVGIGGPVDRTPGQGLRGAQSATFKSLLDQIYWDPAQQGALLIVGPENIGRQRGFAGPGNMGRFMRPAEPPAPDADGKYRLPNLAEPFDHRLVSVGGITVFAPRTMEVLNWKDLPPPDPVAGMGAGQKMLYLESTLTAQQWKKIGSEEGLGANDLNREQRAVYLSLLPEPFTLRHVRPIPTGDNNEVRPVIGEAITEPITLSPAQRVNVRLRLQRELTWNFTTGDDSGSVGMGRSVQSLRSSSGEARYALNTTMMFGRLSAENNVDLFGTRVMEGVPSRLKPGQLPFDWSALQARVDLTSDQPLTVAELIRRTAAVTHVELYCDPRYGTQEAYVRGSSATAGDLLQALCWGVSGTFRKVGPAYVLTDDVAGLGTRHAAIRDWADVGNVMAKKVLEDQTANLAASHYASYVGWDASDPYRPGEALATRLDDLASRPPPITQGLTADGQKFRAAQQPLTPLADLPEVLRTSIAEDIDRYNKDLQSMPPPANGVADFRRSVKADRIRLDVTMSPYFLVPGMGMISAAGPMTMGANLSLRSPTLKPDYNAIDKDVAQPATPAPPKKPSLSNTLETRALLTHATRLSDMLAVAREAKAHGFNQFWIDIPAEESPERTALLGSAIKAGKAAGLPVYVRIDVLRHKPGAGETSVADQTVGGETLTEYATRQSKTMKRFLAGITFDPSAPNNTELVMGGGRAPMPEELDILASGGDWLPIDDDAARRKVFASLAALAKTPGLGGIVLRSNAAPGYRKNIDGMNILPMDNGRPIEEGYTESMRLAFLRRTGIDPIDLSPLQSGMLNIPYGIRSPLFGMRSQVNLRSFPDDGPSGMGGVYMFGGGNVDTISASIKNAWPEWDRFRSRAADRFLVDAAHAIQAQSPGIKVVQDWGGENSAKGTRLDAFGVVDAKTEDVAKSAAKADTGAIVVAANPESGRGMRQSFSRTLLTDQAVVRTRSDSTLFGTTFDPAEWRRSPQYASVDIADLFAYYIESYTGGKILNDWNGIVFDLTRLNPEQTLEAIRILPPANTPPSLSPQTDKGVE